MVLLETRGEFNPKVYVAMFKTVNENGDGRISFQEWVNHYKSMGIPVEHARASFDAMDSDGDGSVSEKEFCNYHSEFFCSTEDKLKSSILFGPL